ncbi:MerR family transcriptional regulator [Kineococcus sp. SYSU DK004]|uniref:MerR family transcriptional regulator n=1 Tax=Kineococcus sp. SYSU DK004 TaxID=3383125 RepID=UPI003D7C5964
MRIGEVAERAGVSVRALRYYEEQGLLSSERTAGGQRRYPDSAVERVRFIQNLYAAGLGSKAVLRILPCVENGVLTDEMHERLLAERARVQAQLDELTATRDKLDDVIRAGQANRPGTTAGARRRGAASRACQGVQHA